MFVNFFIKDIILKKNKVILTQIIRESLWDKIRIDEDNRYYFQGVDTIMGKVIFLKSFGALIQLDDETNGLIPTTYLQKNKIDLQVGQEVEAGQTLIVVSAMKMESEYKAPKNGKVKQIHVKDGDIVAGHQPLVTLE